MWELDLSTGVCRWTEQMAALFGLPRDETTVELARIIEPTKR